MYTPKANTADINTSNAAASKTNACPNNAVAINHLTKSYGKSRGIIDINLAIQEGEFFGFIGPNGAGKSTTIHILLGLLGADSGSASIFGKDIASKDKEVLLSQTGYLPAEAVFYPGMRVRDVIRLSADLRKTDCSRNAQALCERLTLDTSKKVEELSFGNRKKLGIVCALQHNPRLCILDEPTSGLDPFMQREFFAVLKELHAKGTTIFLSSHILSEIQRYCTRAAIIREGRITACDSVEALARTNAKKIHIQLEHPCTDISELTLDGIRDLQKTGRDISFLYSGDMNLLLHFLAAHPIRDLSVAEPDLEEIFMHYYLNTDSKDSTVNQTLQPK